MGKAFDSEKHRKHRAKEAARKAAKFRVVETKSDAASEAPDRRKREVAQLSAPIIIESLRLDDLRALKIASNTLRAHGLTIFMVRTTDEPNDFFGIWGLACLAGAINCATWIAEMIYDHDSTELQKVFVTTLFTRCEDTSIDESSKQFKAIKACLKLFHRAGLHAGRTETFTAVLNSGVVPRACAIWLDMLAEHQAENEQADLDAFIVKPVRSSSVSATL